MHIVDVFNFLTSFSDTTAVSTGPPASYPPPPPSSGPYPAQQPQQIIITQQPPQRQGPRTEDLLLFSALAGAGGGCGYYNPGGALLAGALIASAYEQGKINTVCSQTTLFQPSLSLVPRPNRAHEERIWGHWLCKLSNLVIVCIDLYWCMCIHVMVIKTRKTLQCQ